MANIAVKPAQSPIQADRGAGTRTSVPSAAIDRPRFAEVQDRAREWADKAIDLHQAGYADQAREAERQAEIWLTRMLEMEGEFRSAARSSIMTRNLGSRPWRENLSAEHTRAPVARRPVISLHRPR